MWGKVKIIINAVLLLSFFNLNAQSDIKKIIYDDLIVINQLYNFQIIDTVLVLRYYDQLDTVNKRLNYNEIKQQYNKNVSISNIDTIGNFYVFTVEFKNVSFNCYPQVKTINQAFRYVLYKKSNKWFKINGFITSDIQFLEEEDLFSLRYIDVEKEYQKKLVKALKKGNNEKISSLLTVSILKLYKDVIDGSINAKPIISLPSLNNCESVE